MASNSELNAREQQTLKRMQVLDGTALKLIAAISMAIDHVGAVFFPGTLWIQIIGRLAMPIFAFFIAEGYIHTRDRQAYLMRMGVFALVSELPFDLALMGGVNITHQNILFTFALAIMGLMLYDYLTERYPGTPGIVFGSLAVAVLGALSIALRLDHNFAAIGLVFVFYVFRGYNLLIRNLAAVVFEVLVRNVGIYRWGVLSFFPLMLYNGKRGRGLKLFFYLFYPVHLLVLWLIKLLVG